MMILSEGDYAPDFTLPDQDGKQVSLSSLKGSQIVLYFYPKDDTSGCTMEAQEFSRLLYQFHILNTKVFGLSPDSVIQHKSFIKKYNLDVQLLSDEKRSVLKNYGVWVEKSMYGRKYMGVERTTILIDYVGKVKKVWSKIKISGHAKEVLEDVKNFVNISKN